MVAQPGRDELTGHERPASVAEAPGFEEQPLDGGFDPAVRFLMLAQAVEPEVADKLLFKLAVAAGLFGEDAQAFDPGVRRLGAASAIA